MTAKRVCLACRIRKMRCIRGTPRCVGCTESNIDKCLYVSTKKRGAGSTLGMGEACQRCRKRKRRCDAKQPCTACIRLDGGSECVYDQSRAMKRTRDRLPADAQHFLISFKYAPNPLNSLSPWASEDAGVSNFHVSSPESCGSGASPTQCSTSPYAPLEKPHVTDSNTSETADSSGPQKEPPGMQLVLFRGDSPEPPFQLEGKSTLSFSPLLRLPSIIPRPLHVPFSVMNPKHFQISDTTPSELDLSFRVAALRRFRLFGTHLTGPKQEAVIRAELTNTVVHPFFTHATAALGMHFRANISDTQDVVRLHAKHSQLAWEQIAEISKGNDASLKAQAYLQVATSSLYGRWFDFCRQYLTRACIALNAAKLRFIPTTGRPPELTEDVFEKFAILSQNIYLENYLFLAVDGVEPKMTTRIENEFQHELQQIYPQLFETCPLTMRTQAILLVKGVILMMSLCSADGAGLGRWKQICDEAVARLREYSEILLRNIPLFTDIGDTHGAEIVQNSCVGCLAHLSVLCDLIGRLEPNFKPRMDTVCDWSLERLGTLTKEMSFDEYTYLDLLLKISWERSLAVFDSRIQYLSHEESTSLRRHRNAVSEAWSDFKAKLPNESPLTITAHLTFVDGRQEGSSYPNFMLASERWTYGL